MKKWIGLIVGLSLVSSISGNVVSCSEPVDYSFKLTTDRRQVIDSFNKNDVEDYYLDGFFTIDEHSMEIAINFKSTGLKNYGFRSGTPDYWLKHLVNGLNLNPSQEKYGKKKIPMWVWEYAALWDYENDRPKSQKQSDNFKDLNEY